MTEIIHADLTWTGRRFERDVQVSVAEGRIEGVGASGAKADRRLEHRAILPGFVSAHSHAFQRELRGRGETFPAGSGTFWSWREAMYELVSELDEERFYAVMRTAYEEMRSAGITTVGEFHYLHHSLHAKDYGFDEIVLRAARDAGIRLVLLMTYYRTGGIGQPLATGQKRFETASLEEFWRQVDALTPKLDRATQSLGIAAHSIRGVPADEIEPLYLEARRRGMPFHMHVAEQRREIDECLRAYGMRPMQLLTERLPGCDGVTAIHATHSDAAELEHFLSLGGSVCITPLTEANLGDGIPDVQPLLASPERLSLGTDSNARVSMLEEMRWLEYAQRLASETRGVFRDSAGQGASRLLEFATRSGARALGLNGGEIAAGAVADFVSIDLHAPSIRNVSDEELLSAIVFGASEEIVHATCVEGEWRERLI